MHCPHCKSADVGKFSGKRRVANCKACKKQFTVKSKSIYEDSPLPLRIWLNAMWRIVNAKNGVSSHELARDLGVTQKTAWFVSQRIRLALHEGNFEMMKGIVEADETYIGGMARFMHANVRRKKFNGKTGPVGKTVVMGLLEKHSGKTSRVKAEVIPSLTTAALDSRVRKYVLKGAEVHTDENQAYRKLSGDYVHKFVSHAEAFVQDNVHTNGLENFWCLLKRSIKGTHVHCAPFHLFRYLDDQAFRFNERKLGDGERFARVASSVANRRLTYQKLIGRGAPKTTRSA